MNEEHKSIQLEQKIIHLKSELEKYKAMLASFPSDQQPNDLKEQMEQLTIENAQLQEKCRHYEDTISTRNHKIDHLSTELEETKKENRLLYDEMEGLKRENFILQKKVEANEEKIKSLLNDVAASKQRQAELEKEKEIMKEKTHSLERELSSHHVLMNEYLSFKSELQSLTFWIERIKTMEKEYDFLKKNSDKALSDFQDLKEVLFVQKKETEDLKEEIRLLTKKFHAIEENLSEMDREKQKDLAVLQKHILHQHVEMESILEKTAQFAKEIEKISKQLSDLTERIDQKREDSSNPEMNEMKEMLSQLVQLLTPQPNTSYVEEKQKETTPSPKQPDIMKNTRNTTSHTNSFLKLNEFIDETQQSIVVSPINKKGKNPIHPQLPYVYPQKSNQIKNIRIETKLPQQLRHKKSEEDDDKSPNPVTSPLLYTTTQDKYLDTQLLNHTFINDILYDIPELTTELSTITEKEQNTLERIETEVSEHLVTQQLISEQDKEEIHYETNPHTTLQEAKDEESDVHEIFADMKSDEINTEVKSLVENDEVNASSLSENKTTLVTIANIQETMEIEENLVSSYKENSETDQTPLAEFTSHDEPAGEENNRTTEATSQNSADDLSHEKENIGNKWNFLSLFKKAKVFK